MEAGGWLLQIHRGLRHVKVPDAAIDAVGHLGVRSEETKSGFASTWNAIACHPQPFVLKHPQIA